MSFFPEFDTFFLRFFNYLTRSSLQNLRHQIGCRAKKSLTLRYVYPQETQPFR